jgi:hypothetical protein
MIARPHAKLLLAAIALAASLAVAPPAARGAAESIELRLLRSVQLGVLQGLSVGEVGQFRRDGTRAGYLGFALAVAAGHATGQGSVSAEWSAPRLLDKTLGELTIGLGFPAPPDFAPGFGNEDLVFTLVYALAMGGSVEQATDVLERHLGGATEYKRAVVLQALRNLGTPRASNLIQKEAERGGGDNLAQNLLSDLHYPFHEDLRSRLALIPPHERTRERLAVLAAEGCGIKPALATYFLGFFPEAKRPDEESRELALLRRLASLDCHWTRFLAIRSLALRSAESIEFWTRLYKNQKDGWQKAQLARIGWARFGQAFAPTALQWLSGEPVQYVQWELMHGTLEAARGTVLRDYWDIWLPPSLDFRLKFHRYPAGQEAPLLEPILAWLEAGDLPLNAWVRNHLFHGLARDATGAELRRFLRAFSRLPNRGELWWVLRPLSDKSALPILRYWEELETNEAHRRDARDVVTALQAREAGHRSDMRSSRPAAQPCCRPTRECLLAHVESTTSVQMRIIDEAQAQAWLEGRGPENADPAVQFLDALERVAEVSADAGTPQRWEHLYGCWRPVRP